MKVGRLSFVALDGDPPEGLHLDRLPDSGSVARIIDCAFKPFAASDAFERVQETRALQPSADGLHVIYVFGHAWIGLSGLEVSLRDGASSTVQESWQLLDWLLEVTDLNRCILILDCCHAAAFDEVIARRARPPLLCVYGASREEKAIAVLGDQASRLSLAFRDVLAAASKSEDFVQIVAEISRRLDRNGVLRGQTVTYRMHGYTIALDRALRSQAGRRERTVTLIRNILLGVGALGTLAAVAGAWYYWSHVLIEVDLGDLPTIADGIELLGTSEKPSENLSSVFTRRPLVDGSRLRIWAPADNIIIRALATYRDGNERALAFHLQMEPSFDPVRKFITVSFPSAKEIGLRPGMAFVPVTTWFHGQELEPLRNDAPFWIDIQPPTVDEYLPIARALLSSGKLQKENSFLLTSNLSSNATDTVKFNQLSSLSGGLGAMFGDINQAALENISVPADIVEGLPNVPCGDCPAPMTRFEAELYCLSLGKRIPTNFEWELAARGVDGRDFPWGNRVDKMRANVPGLPEKGEPPPELKPVYAYREFPSPFGLIDTVGNAGDWVSGSYQRVYMGATYQFNPEDATVFQQLPVTESDYLFREITVRCAADGGSASLVEPP